MRVRAFQAEGPACAQVWTCGEAETVCSGNGVQLGIIDGKMVSKRGSGEL